AKENNKKAIGVDQDQNYLAPENIITSAMKNIDVAMLNLCKTMLEGNYKGGQVIVNTLETGGVGIAPTTDKNVAPDVLKYVNEMAEKVKSGDIKVPETKEELKEAFPEYK
ncbi:MAG: BMP family lipoprotein, partial [Peptostreptococcaceae bacterium]